MRPIVGGCSANASRSMAACEFRLRQNVVWGAKIRRGDIRDAGPQLQLFVGDEGECGFDPFGYGAGSPALSVYEYPIGFTPRNESAVG